MKLFSPFFVILGVVALGCGSTSSRGTVGSGGQAGSPANTGSGGISPAGSGGAGTQAGTGGAPATSGSGGAGGGRSGTGGDHGTGGVAGGGHSGTGGGGIAGAGGTGGCAAGQIWCPGCTEGTGTCSVVGCPAAQCPVQDAGMSDAPGGCSTATSDSDCAARAGCHSVFVDAQNCGCSAIGCCARFSRCADGPALCTATNISCTIQVPHCEGAYVVSYAGGCYEGCVRSTECASGNGGAGGGGAGGQGGSGAGGATGQSCSSAPPVDCPTGQICDYDTPNRCGAGYEPGHCIVMPEGCTSDYTPVCGCDNKTYPNDCARRQARQQLSHTGACT